jgi:hypothetical protein
LLRRHDVLKAPPLLDEALLHAACTRFGRLPPEPAPELRLCPCCCCLEPTPLPVCAPLEALDASGPVVPLFLDFSQFLIRLTCFFCLFAAVGQYYIIKANCEKMGGTACIFDYQTLSDYRQREFIRFRFMFQDISAAFLIGNLVVYVWAFFNFHKRAIKLKEKIDKGMITASDYTVMMYDIAPENESKEYIQNYMAELLGPQARLAANVARVNVAKFEGYLQRLVEEAAGLQQAIERLEQRLAASESAGLRAALAELQERKRQVEARQEAQRWQMEERPELRQNSVAFVSFEQPWQAAAVAARDTRLRLAGWLLSKALPGLFRHKRHLVVQAPEPDEVHWRLAGFSLWRRALGFGVSFAVMLLVLCASFFAQMGIQQLKNSQQQARQQPTAARLLLARAVGVSSGVFVSVTNVLLVALSAKLSKYEKHLSHSMFILSHTKKLVLLQFINSACIAVALTYLPERFGRLDNLAGYVFTNEANNLLLGPLLYACDPAHLFDLFRQAALKRQLARRELPGLAQKDLNELFEPADMAIYLRYCSVIRTFFVSCFFFYVLPFNMVMCAVFLTAQYWLDRYMVLRRYRRAARLHALLSFELAKFSELGLLLLCLSNVLFKSQEGRFDRAADLVCLLLALALQGFPLFEAVRSGHADQSLRAAAGPPDAKPQPARNT